MQQTALQIGDFVEFMPPAFVAPPCEPEVHYMLRVVANKELKIEDTLKSRGIVVYLPKETETRRVRFGVYRPRTVAIFSGVIFVADFDADLLRLKALADGIIGFVRFDTEPLKVRPKMMESIRKFERLLDIPPGQRKRAFYVSQEVRIKGGSLDMWMGHVASLDPRRRITVLVNLLGRMVPVELPEDQVEAV